MPMSYEQKKTLYVGVAQLNDGEYIFTGDAYDGASESLEDAMKELDNLVKQSHPGGTPRKVGVVTCYDADVFDAANQSLGRYPSKGGYKGGYFSRLSNFSERLNKLFSKASKEAPLSTVIWLDGSGKVHEDQFNYDEVSKEASERYSTPVDQLTDIDIVGRFLYEAYPRHRITPFVKILKDGDNKEEVAAELKKMFNKKS